MRAGLRNNEFCLRGLSPIICQHVNYELHAELIKSKLCGTFSDVACNTDVEVPELNEDKENIICYAAGYIPFKLLKKDEKNDYDRVLV